MRALSPSQRRQRGRADCILPSRPPPSCDVMYSPDGILAGCNRINGTLRSRGREVTRVSFGERLTAPMDQQKWLLHVSGGGGVPKRGDAPGQTGLLLFKGCTWRWLALFYGNVSGPEFEGEVSHHPSRYGAGVTSERGPGLGLGRAGLLSGTEIEVFPQPAT